MGKDAIRNHLFFLSQYTCIISEEEIILLV